MLSLQVGPPLKYFDACTMIDYDEVDSLIYSYLHYADSLWSIVYSSPVLRQM